MKNRSQQFPAKSKPNPVTAHLKGRFQKNYLAMHSVHITCRQNACDTRKWEVKNISESQEGAAFKVWLFRAFDSSQNWSYRTGWDPSTWIWHPAPNLNVCISATQDLVCVWNAWPKWAQETRDLLGGVVWEASPVWRGVWGAGRHTVLFSGNASRCVPFQSPETCSCTHRDLLLNPARNDTNSYSREGTGQDRRGPAHRKKPQELQTLSYQAHT